MTYLSVCSGIEAATVAWHPLGWKPWAFAEVDRFPSRVLEARWPGVPNLGDITQWKDWPDAALDLIVGGTPCQSFSVAGLRRGLADPRGGLLFAYLAIARRYRPRWVVWENVPGVLSIDGGRAFGTLLGALAELGYGFAWRVLDAQFVRVDGYPRAVPQRRKRLFVVGHLGDWRRAAAVLVERASLSGHPAPRREAGKEVAGTLGGSSQRGGFRTTDRRTADDAGSLIVMSSGQANAEIREDGGAPSLTCLHEAPIVTANALLTPNGGRSGIGVGAVAFNARQDPDVSGDVTHPLGAKDSGHGVLSSMRVRRLTPRECERLQGFPDDYTLIATKGKPAADGPRYKALGNSMAVPVMRWIGRRVQMVEAL